MAAAAAPFKGRGVPLRVATGIVTRAGTCDKTVKVRLGGETWNHKVKKASVYERGPALAMAER